MSQSDHELISNHLARYCFLVDSGTCDEIAELFWDDATLEFNGWFDGKDAIRACYANWIADMRDPVEGLRHLIHIPLIEIEGAAAQSRCYADADAHSRRKGRAIQNRAQYLDRFSKRDGVWKFLERRIVWMRGLQDTGPAASK